MLRKKKSLLLVILSIFLLTACSSNSMQENSPQPTISDESESLSENYTRSISVDEYEVYQSLLKEQEFKTSPEYHQIQITSLKFAKACLNKDEKTISSLLADKTVNNNELWDAADDFEFILIKDIRRSDDSEATNNRYNVSCEFLPKGEDSYSYLTMEVIYTDETWRISSYGFEK